MNTKLFGAVLSVWFLFAGATTVFAEEVTNPVVEPVATTTEEIIETATSTDPVVEETATTTPVVVPPVPVTLSIESQTTSLFSGALNVTPCPETQGSATTTINAFCALEQAGIPVTWSWWGDDAFLDTISGVGNDYALGNYWLWFTDLEAGTTSFNKHTLHDNENLLVTIGRMPMKLEVSTTTPQVGATTTITVSEFGFDANWNSVWLPSASSTVTIGTETFTTDAAGVVEFTPTQEGSLSVAASKSGFLNSMSSTLSVLPAPIPATPITLRIESTSATIFNNELEVTPCPETEGSATTTINAFCALEQAGVPVSWSWWGEDAFLDSISGVSNDYSAGLYWSWFTNLEMGATSFNKHVLTDDESLLVTIGRMPTKIVPATTTPVVGATTTMTVYEFGFDANWNSVWLPSASSTVTIGTETFTTDDSGVVSFTPMSTSSVTVSAAKTGFLGTDVLTLTPTAQSGGSNSGNAGGVGGGVSTTNPLFNTALAYAYLASVQKSDGSFGSSMISDWVAVTFGGAGAPSGAKDALRAYLSSSTPTLSSATDYERHSMALLSLGIDPQTKGGNYVSKIISFFDGVQIGDPSLVNDDIFALFPFAHTGYTTNDDVIKKTIQFIVSKQSVQGHWDSIDVTAAGIQALALFPGEPGVSDAMSRAKVYLKANQSSDGGWWNVFSTGWVLQAIGALSEQASSWVSGGHAPQDTLALAQSVDGSVGPSSESEMNKIWGTAYAIPGVLGAPWHTTMSTFPKKEISIGGAPPEQATTTATTTLEIATSTETVLEKKGMASTTPETLESLATTTIATSTSTTTLPVVKKAPPKKVAPPAPKTPEIQANNQQAQVPENPLSSLIGSFWGSVGQGIRAFFGWLF